MSVQQVTVTVPQGQTTGTTSLASYGWQSVPTLLGFYPQGLIGVPYTASVSESAATVTLGGIDVQADTFILILLPPGVPAPSGWTPFSPTFATLAEVVAHLNLSGPDGNGNYTVFGLIVPATTVYSMIDHANKYVNSLVPSLQEGSSDPRLSSAELAATDLACMDILVVSVGGALVGAYDYSLGDQRVSRAGPYASAVKAAIAGYRANAVSELQNVTTVAMSAEAAAVRQVPFYRGAVISP